MALHVTLDLNTQASGWVDKNRTWGQSHTLTITCIRQVFKNSWRFCSRWLTIVSVYCLHGCSFVCLFVTVSLMTAWCVPYHVGDKPTLRDLLCFKYNGTQHKIHIIYTVASRWKALGLLLNIGDYHLNNIERNHGNVEDRCQTMLSDWLQGTVGDGPVTWETCTGRGHRWCSIWGTAWHNNWRESCLIVVRVL